MVANDDLNLASLLSEESLFEVYRSAPSFFSNQFNGWALVLTSGPLAILMGLHLSSQRLRVAYPIPFADIFAVWANTGVSLAGTILGFLIAGFAVLCTVLQPQTMIALHRIPNQQYGKSQLKLLFINFVEVLVQYLTLLLLSVIVLIFGGKTGPAAMLGSYLARVHWLIPFSALHILFFAWGTLFLVVVLTLKSFVYNLYATLLLGIADAADDYHRNLTPTREASKSDHSCGQSQGER